MVIAPEMSSSTGMLGGHFFALDFAGEDDTGRNTNLGSPFLWLLEPRSDQGCRFPRDLGSVGATTHHILYSMHFLLLQAVRAFANDVR